MFTRTLCGIAALALVASACWKTPVGAEMAGVVVTLVDSGPDLRAARTFALPDTVVEVPVGSTMISHAADHEVVIRVRNHFTTLGWKDLTKVSGAHPDVVILIAASERTESSAAYAGWFGAWGFLPYWSAGVNDAWTWGLPGGAIPFVYQAGTLLITMLDLHAQDQSTRTIPLLWAGVLDGILSASTELNTQRVFNGIDQAFEQSPYLRIQ